jgi:uncharacterized protein YecE (DUF72 family)
MRAGGKRLAMSHDSSNLRIGVSGFRYAPWRGVFYPKGLRQADELGYLSRQVDSVELNGSFYSLQLPRSYVQWSRATPDGFVFALKGGRYVTHMKRLLDVRSALANFFASGVLCLGSKLGPILWQLPPTLAFDSEVLANFLRILPRTIGEVEVLAKEHDGRTRQVALHAAPDVPRSQRVEHAIEVRHPSFVVPGFAELLRVNDVACCIADSAGRFPQIDAVTSTLVYVRLHGSTKLYESGYTQPELEQWALRVRRWLDQGHRVHVYFDNDAKVHAPFNAMDLARMLRT